MRYPNLRYGNPTEFAYYVTTHHDGIQGVAKQLRRSERSIRDWMNGRQRVPWWVPEILRLKRLEANQQLRQMGIQPQRGFGLVTHEGQLELRRPERKKPQPMTALRPDDFDRSNLATSYGA